MSVPFDADGASWKLSFSVNALCQLEQLVEDPEAVKRLVEGEETPLQVARAAVWAGLQDHHPELTLDDAGALMGHLGLPRIGGLVAQALIAAFPPASERKARPRKAAKKTA